MSMLLRFLSPIAVEDREVNEVERTHSEQIHEMLYLMKLERLKVKYYSKAEKVCICNASHQRLAS